MVFLAEPSRADGVDLTGNLYLPKGYDKSKDGPMPVLMWEQHRFLEKYVKGPK